MTDRESVNKNKELFERLSEALDARNQFIQENGPEDQGYYEKLNELDREMWSAHSRWKDSIITSQKS